MKLPEGEIGLVLLPNLRQDDEWQVMGSPELDGTANIRTQSRHTVELTRTSAVGALADRPLFISIQTV